MQGEYFLLYNILKILFFFVVFHNTPNNYWRIVMKTIKKYLKILLISSLTAVLFFSCNTPTASVTSGGTDTYNEPTLPEGEGTDPFKGHTYRSGSSSSSYTEYAFGNDNNILTYSMINNGTCADGIKFQYSYNANTRELNLKILQVRGADIRNDTYNWFTYSQLNASYNITYSEYTNYMQRHSTLGPIMSETEFNQHIPKQLDFTKTMFEKITVYKAEEDTSQNLKLRTAYYKARPSEIPCVEPLSFNYNNSNPLSLSILRTLNSYPNRRGTIYKNPTYFLITNINSNTMTAVQATQSTTGLTPDSDGQQMQMTYTLTLGDDNNLVLTLTSSDATFTNTFNSTRITLSTSTGSETYTKQ